MTCAIIGDSIALALSFAHPGCFVSAHVGAPPSAIYRSMPMRCVDLLVISAGSNPDKGGSPEFLHRISGKVCAKRVVWVVPRDPRASQAVRLVASLGGDATATFRPAQDGVHPASPRSLWDAVARAAR